MILPDLLAPNLRVIFCGTAASAISAREGAYYANPTNAFWKTLHRIELTPQQLQPAQFRQLLQYRIGLTDIAKAATGNDADLSPDDYDPHTLRQKIEHYQPHVLAFTSKKGASVFLSQRTSQLNYGQQPVAIGTTILWILPSPSGAARRYWEIAHWHNLADYLGTLPEPS